MANINRKHRRGLSSVVGAVFMILVMLGALNVILLALQQQDKVTQAVVEKSNASLGKLNEQISISEVRLTSGNKLNMTVTNNGGSTAKLASIYIVNETASPKQQYRYDLNSIPVDGRASEPNIGTNLALNVKSNTKYSVKVVTEAGNTAATTVTPLSTVALPMSLYIIPPTVTPTGSNVTILFAVTNNLTDSVLGMDVTPTLDIDTTCSPTGPGCRLIEKQAPSGSVSLTEGNTILFKWVYQVDMPDLSFINFNASLVNAKQGNFVTETALVKKIDESNVSESSTLVVFSDLVQKPEIFVIAPGPYGEASQMGLWGVVVANPTELPMEVYRVIFTLYNTDPSSSNKILAANCHTGDDNPVFPDVESEWTCPNINKLEWKRLGGESIPAYGIKTFMNLVEPSSIASDEASFLITATVFTNLGQFAKTGYAASMKDGGEVLGNVYFTTTGITEANARQEANIKGHIENVQDGTDDQLFRVVISDFDSSTSTEMLSGLRLVINVPKEFKDVKIYPQPNGHAQFTETSYVYDDNSTQIVATLDAGEDIGDVSGSPCPPNCGESKIIEFTADVPTVTKKKVYIFYTLLDGETAGGFSVSAFGQIAVQVIP